MSQSSLNLTARDFDAYLAEKATSNAFSRPRLELKQRALGWARSVLARLSDLGIVLDLHGSDEHPSLRNKKRVDCQWILFWRDQQSREHVDRLLDDGRSISEAIDAPDPHTRHAVLALRIDSQSVEVCFAMQPDAKVDADNLRALLDTAGGYAAGAVPPPPASDADALAPSPAAELIHALRELPEQFLIGTSLDDRVPTTAATPEAIEDMLACAAAGKSPLWIGWSVPREVAVEHSTILDEQLEDALVALAPIYRLIAWSPDNDHIALRLQLDKIGETRARTHAEAEAQNEKWKAEQAAARARSLELARERCEEAARNRSPSAAGLRTGPGAAGTRPSLSTLFKPQTAQRDMDTENRRAPSLAASASTGASDVAVDYPVKPFALVGPTIEKGTRVRVLAGPFADKVGLVSELDGRGGARVLLGLLSTRLDLNDLEPVVEGRERPSLQSSHRRPVAPVPRRAR